MCESKAETPSRFHTAIFPRRVICRLTAAHVFGITPLMLIYKIFRSPEWDALCKDGQSAGAPIDLADGYIHFSTAEQVAETAAKHFAGADDLVLSCLDADALGDKLIWEPSRGGALFPHLYRQLRLADVLWTKPLPLKGGAHEFPKGVL